MKRLGLGPERWQHVRQVCAAHGSCIVHVTDVQLQVHMFAQPPTTTSLSLKQAAEQVGRDRTTLLRAIKSGDLSATKDEAGQWWIEASELFRRYPAQAHNVQEGVNAQVSTGVSTASHTPDLAREIASKEEQLAALNDERQRERRQLEDTIADLRRRLDVSEEERRQKDQQLTALLTDQRSREKKAAEQPEAAPATPSKKPGRWWERLFLLVLVGGLAAYLWMGQGAVQP